MRWLCVSFPLLGFGLIYGSSACTLKGLYGWLFALAIHLAGDAFRFVSMNYMIEVHQLLCESTLELLLHMLHRT